MVFKKLKIELSYDPAIPLLGIYPDKTIIGKYTCTFMFIAALFTIAKTWKQFKCLLTDEWIKNEIMPFSAIWTDLEIIILSEVSQKQKDKYHMILLLYVESKKKIQVNLFTKQEQTDRHRKQAVVTKGARLGEGSIPKGSLGLKYIHYYI